MSLENLIALFLLNYLRRNSEKPEPFPDTNRLIIIGMVIAGILSTLGMAHVGPRALVSVLSLALMGAIFYGVLIYPAFSKARPIVMAILPYVSITFLGEFWEILIPDSHKGFEALFKTAEFFAFVWAVAQWWISRKQRKALEIQRMIATEKERELALTEKIKAQLEVEVAERTAALTMQKEELEKALNNLKATQEQLILAEKMASLGELTAGIAHEIQNPLNFVNNFSEVSNELIQELRDEIDSGQSESSLENQKELLQDISQNLEKITFHGKRADAIVKSMLQHSRKETGKKELTDINKLADEYLRLSYHGLRAKDKSFFADFHLQIDENLPLVEVIPQEIGRVLLNLINNAFYAASEKKKDLEEQGKLGEFKPQVWVVTQKRADGVNITIRDNGNGIPEDIRSKIFQPFFTTKPAGSGTGLGLSMSYDIVTKSHNGNLQVKSKEGEFTEFIVFLKTKKS